MVSVNFKGAPVKLGGKEVRVGEKAPEVEVTAQDLSAKKVGGAAGKAQLLIAVPSLDTSVCATEARRFNNEAASLSGAEVLVISMDLPFAAKRFCSTEGIKGLSTASDFRARKFAKAYGILIDEGPLAGLLCRAVFVVGKDGTLAYKELVAEITQEPDYAAALKALKAAA